MCSEVQYRTVLVGNIFGTTVLLVRYSTVKVPVLYYTVRYRYRYLRMQNISRIFFVSRRCVIDFLLTLYLERVQYSSTGTVLLVLGMISNTCLLRVYTVPVRDRLVEAFTTVR